MLWTQHNAWVHALATAAALIAGFTLQISPGEWLAIILAIIAVWTAEALNTAFESLCGHHRRVDRRGAEYRL